jgi:short subunit dehydrogenase-like uncharacterized protein
MSGEPAAPGSYRVLVLGGTGVFGTLLCRRLARDPAIRVIVAGRDAERAARLAQSLLGAESVAVDLHRDLPAALLHLHPALVIHCAGPFQEQDYAVARACVARRIAYLDLADGRRFVSDIAALDTEARVAGVAVVSGASSVPAISAAAVRALSADLVTLERIAVAILPGNRAPRGPAVVAAILGQAGQRIRVREDGRPKTRYGWHDLRRTAIPGLGRRWASVVDVPDLELFPARWPGLRTATFHAGLELSLLHLGLWALAWPVRLGLVGSLRAAAPMATRIATLLQRFGTDRGGMVVEVDGRDAAGAARRRRWTLVAEAGQGPFVPVLPAAIAAKRLAHGAALSPGARPALDIVTLEELAVEAADLAISFRTEELA